jgi:hydrogenase-4 component E
VGALLDLLLVAVVLTNLLLLGSSRLGASIRLVAIQGVLLGFLPILAHADLSLRLVLLAVVAMLLKGMAFPWLLSRAVREAEVRREEEPFVGFNASVLAGLVLTAVSFWVASRLPVPAAVRPLVVPLALATLLSGFFIIVARTKALTQVLGYLVLENGIFIFGVALAAEQPFLVEMGVLLDVFVGVFVMGIAIFHIQRTFDHIDVHRLSTLHDWSA